MAAVKYRPHIGDTLWRVEWCAELVFDECGDVDRDQCKMVCRSFRTREAARAHAEKMYPIACETFGVVEVDEIEFVPYDADDVASMPHVGFWEERGETEIFSGEWE